MRRSTLFTAQCYKSNRKYQKSSCKKKSKEWWDENFEKIHSEMKYQLWMYKASNYKDKNSKTRYKRLKKDFRNMQRKKLSETEKRFIKLLNNCSESDKFWKLVNSKRKKKTKCDIKIDKLKTLFHENFNKKITNQSENQDELKKQILDYEKKIVHINKEQVEINRENVIKIIKNLPNNKSIGFGEINNELYKYGLSNLLIELVATIMEKVINSGIIPNFFNVGKISPVVKDEKKAKNDVNNIRPITISDTLANIYEKLIMIELDKSHNGVPNQFGFTSKSSCNHAVFAEKARPLLKWFRLTLV